MNRKNSNNTFVILLLIIGFLFIGLIGFIVSAQFNAFEIVHNWFEKHETQNLDEIAIVIFIWFICLFIVLIIKHRNGLKQKNELIKLSLDLQANLNNKNKLFSILGHDLRTPFNSLIGFSDLLLRKYDLLEVHKQKEMVSIINNTSKSTLILLNNLLDWARMETNDLIIEKQNINLKEIIEDARGLLGSVAHSKNISINNNIPDNTLVFADENMISTVIRNLLSNAIKYSPNDTYININASIIDDFVEVTFSDSGIGLTQDQIEQLFTQVSLSTPGTNNEIGTGLGLKICKDFIELNNGTIWVESIKGKGSDFIFILPAVKNNQ